MTREYAEGDRIGKYVVVRRIGAGGHGTTLLVRHQVLKNKRFALKILHARLIERPDLVERMNREAQVLASMNHPNIVTVLDADVTDESPPRPFFVMEYLSGKSVRDVLVDAARGIGLSNALGISIDVADALDYAHVRFGVIHRDLKPDNVYLNYTAKDVTVTKLLDFGIAHVVSTLAGAAGASRFRTDENTTIGTPKYMAPEQLQAKPPTPKTDLYALGLLLYELLTGRGPFDDARTLDALGRAHLTRPPPPFMHQAVPPELERLVMALLAKGADDRPKSAAWVATELRQVRHRAEVDYGRALPALEKTDESPLENIMTTTAMQHADHDADGRSGEKAATDPGMPLPPVEGSTTLETVMGFDTTLLSPAAHEERSGSSPDRINRQAPTRSLPAGNTPPARGRHDTEPIAKSPWSPPTVEGEAGDKVFVDLESLRQPAAIRPRPPIPAHGRVPGSGVSNTSGGSVAISNVSAMRRNPTRSRRGKVVALGGFVVLLGALAAFARASREPRDEAVATTAPVPVVAAQPASGHDETTAASLSAPPAPPPTAPSPASSATSLASLPSDPHIASRAASPPPAVRLSPAASSSSRAPLEDGFKRSLDESPRRLPGSGL